MKNMYQARKKAAKALYYYRMDQNKPKFFKFVVVLLLRTPLFHRFVHGLIFQYGFETSGSQHDDSIPF